MVYLYEIAQLYELPSRNKLRSLNQLATGYRRAGRIVMRRLKLRYSVESYPVGFV